jgi:hypothetical protein
MTITSVSIPEGIEVIEADAFRVCTKLVQASIPSSVTTIGRYAFYGCGFKELPQMSNVKTIDDFGFSSCFELETIIIPDCVESIGEESFSRSKVTKIVIPKNIKVGKYAFSQSVKLVSVSLPDDLEEISVGMFKDAEALASITIPTGVKSIEEYAFYRCVNLTEIVIPNSVSTIGEDAFAGCRSIQTVHIGSGVAKIFQYAFSSCSALSAVYTSNPTPPGLNYRRWDSGYEAQSGSGSFENKHYSSVDVYVPTGTLDAYKNDPYWKNFFYFNEYDFPSTSVESVKKDSKEKQFYSLKGENKAFPQQGLNIIKLEDGTVKKIIAK